MTVTDRAGRPFSRACVAAIGLAAIAAAGCTGTGTPARSHLAAKIRPSCPAPPKSAAITLADTEPTPSVIVPAGARLVVMVPRWGWGQATTVAHGRLLREVCTVVLPGGARRTIFIALRPGSTYLGATVKPASNLMMPSWGGRVTVQPAAS